MERLIPSVNYSKEPKEKLQKWTF